MHIYFSGIGGSGLSGLAHLALDLGFIVSGSDLETSEIIENLKLRGAKITTEQTLENIQKVYSKTPIDWFLYTSALKFDHIELQFVNQKNLKIENLENLNSQSNLHKNSQNKSENESENSENLVNLSKSSKTLNSKIKISKRDVFINFIIQKFNLKLIAIAGTHGKTTTTAMLIWLFKQLQIPVSYLVGSEISFGNSGQWEPKSEYFVLECDEFDRNFLKFYPEIAIIPSLDYDHPDTYPSIVDYNEAFCQFCNQTKTQIIPSVGAIEKIRETAKNRQIFDKKPVRIAGGFGENLEKIKLIGLHNRQNAELVLFAIAMILGIESGQKNLEIGFEKYKIYDKIATFPGTSRRFEKLADGIYSDYAHHPSEIIATLELVLELENNKNS